ncbi:hypothetical protein [Thermomonospora umbrina]|uniref:Carboxypeptidase regulatory-like domain-containing protein n=1 Tax=Thermomonospora umbrina TaxID=111806 RepID=A0A3D9SN28_9ACTN|nr:hypothetical protein [Thermomonospora umbrina]REE97342.1 hypothetical protein DFJ69_2809 [Thermomonospora umbrina]
MRRLLLSLLCAVVTTGALVAPAHANTSTYVKSATNAFEKLDTLTITFEGDVPVKSVRASLRPTRTTTTPPVEVTEFTLGEHQGGRQTATATGVRPSALDDYVVDVEAYDTDDRKIAVDTWGSYRFFWLIRPKIQMRLDRTAVDVDHPVIVADGSVTGTWPTGEVAPLPGRTFHILTESGFSGSPRIPVTTDTEGRFTATLTPGPSIAAEMNCDHTPAIADLGCTFTSATAIKITKASSRLSLTSTPHTVAAGGTVTVGGRLEGFQGGQWRPLPGRPINLRIRDDHGRGPADRRLTTDANGRFTTRVTVKVHHGFTATWAGEGVFYNEISATASVTVPTWVHFRNVTAKLTPYGDFSFSGTAWGGDRPLTRRNVTLEYSLYGKTGWREVRKLPLNYAGEFSTRMTIGQSGHWRVRYLGDASHKPSTSPVRKTWRWGTRMPAMKVSPTRVRRYGFVTASGVLNRYYNTKQRKPTAFKGQRVRIIFRFKGKKTWYHLGWDTTDSRGRFSARVRAHGDGYYAAVFHGTKDTWAVGSPNTPYVDTYGSSAGRAPTDVVSLDFLLGRQVVTAGAPAAGTAGFAR